MDTDTQFIKIPNNLIRCLVHTLYVDITLPIGSVNQAQARFISNLVGSNSEIIIDCLWNELTSTAEAIEFVSYLMKDLLRETNLEILSLISYEAQTLPDLDES